MTALKILSAKQIIMLRMVMSVSPVAMPARHFDDADDDDGDLGRDI